MTGGSIILGPDSKPLATDPTDLARTPEGLLVPKDSIKREARTWTNDLWKKLQRLARLAREEKFSLILICDGCKQALQADDAMLESTGRLFINCQCATREVKRIK